MIRGRPADAADRRHTVPDRGQGLDHDIYTPGMEPLSEEQVERVVGLAMQLAREGRTGELVEFFEHGLPLDAKDKQGNTALMLAAYRGHVETVRTLIGLGADVDLRNNRDQSPIAGALFKGEAEVVTLLRKAGADLDAGVPTAREAAGMFGQEALLG